MMRKYRDVKTPIDNVLAHITYAAQANGQVRLRGYPISSSTGVKIDGFGTPILRMARSANDVSVVEQQLVIAIVKKMCKSSTPRSNATVNKEISQVELIVRRLIESDTLIYPGRWGASTQRKALTHYRNKIIPYLRLQGELCCQSDVRELHDMLVNQVLKHGRSHGSCARAEQTINIEMGQDDLVHKYLRATYPELNLPDISLACGRSTRTYQPEQVKVLPLATRRKFVEALMQRRESEPNYVMGAVLMLDAGLRTAEACAVWKDVLSWQDGYAVISVVWQIKDGKRAEQLKREASYRQVVVSYWGMNVLKMCINTIETRGVEITGETPIALPIGLPMRPLLQ